MNINEIRNTPALPPLQKKSQKALSEPTFESQLKNAEHTTARPQDVLHQGNEHPAALTSSEREYFERLFPNSAEEIRTYSPYQNDKSKAAAKLGSLLDRKG
jgi:hypothetical protein